MNRLSDCATISLSLRTLFIVFSVIASVSITIIRTDAQDESTIARRYFDPAVNAFLVNDMCFYLPALFESEVRFNAEDKVGQLFDEYAGLSLGIVRTTALLYESGCDANGWLFFYDKSSPDYYFAYERAYAIGYYNETDSQGKILNGIPGTTMWSKFIVDPNGSLFRTIVELNEMTDLERHGTEQIAKSQGMYTINYEEAKRVVECIEDGHPCPIGLFVNDPQYMHVVLAYDTTGENRPGADENSIVLVVWDSNNIRDYYTPDEEGYSPDDYDYIEISPSGEIKVSLVHATPDYYKYIVYDSQYDPQNSILTDNINESLTKQAEAMGKSWD